MLRRNIACFILLSFLISGISHAQTLDMKPFTMDWRDNSGSLVDLSFLLDAPAGKDGFIRSENGHFVKPDGRRFRIWGVNVTAAACLPSRQDAPVVAAHLARFGINCIRFHFLDSNWSGGLFFKGSDDTRALDPKQLDKLDYFIAELKKRGIYTNLNLNVGRNYRKGDGVKDYEYLGLAKVINYFDERVQMLHKEYAQQLLTHRNPYTGNEYRNEPAVLIVELVNENSIVESWFGDRLLGKNTSKNPGTWADITAAYAEQLTEQYNAWLKKNLSGTELAELRRIAGVGENDLIPRLKQDQFDKAPKERFYREAAFYMELEDTYFQSMYGYLRKNLGVKSLVAGTSDHNHSKTGYPLLSSTSKLDIVDGHVYWQHPNYLIDPETQKRTFSIPNTPMVKEPFNSTVVQLSRSAVAGKPYTISETNHPFPSEYACEGIGILAAYASFHDWDGIFFYTFEHKDPNEWQDKMPGHFEIRPDPVKMTNLAACAMMFLRGDVRPAVDTVERKYTTEQIYEGIRASYSERPYFTPGFDLSIPLQHTTRIASLNDEPKSYQKAEATNPVTSDTNELTWYYPPQQKGLVTIETDKSQALIGFVKDGNKSLRNLAASVENEFCSIIVTSMDGQPISGSRSLLLVATARAANNGMKWNTKRTTLESWGDVPLVIEPVKGQVNIRNIKPCKSIEVFALNGAGKPLGKVPTTETADGIAINAGETVTTWYLININR